MPIRDAIKEETESVDKVVKELSLVIEANSDQSIQVLLASLLLTASGVLTSTTKATVPWLKAGIIAVGTEDMKSFLDDCANVHIEHITHNEHKAHD